VKTPCLRHDLIWLNPEIDAGLFAVKGQEELAGNWVKNNFPMVVARQPEQLVNATKHIVLGFTLPSAPARTRVMLQADRAAIMLHRRPILLADAIQFAPEIWRENMLKLNALCTNFGVTVRVYGSLSTEIFTGNKYLDEASDLDLLLECNENTKLAELLFQLEHFAMHPRFDGEILAPSGWAVAWRELATALRCGSPKQVLAKSVGEIRMLPVEHFMQANLLAA
jgi:phosphoribosyl-dephospho-CoA transferase